MICLLKNTTTIDYITIKNYLKHYDGLYNKLICYDGTNISNDIAIKFEAEAYQFCREVDPAMPHNKNKTITSDNLLLLPIGKWVKLASDIAIRQNKLEEKESILFEKETDLDNQNHKTQFYVQFFAYDTNLGILNKIVTKLEENLKDLEEYLKSTNEEYQSLSDLINNVIIIF